ncbi:MAG: hypothetical protein FJ267_15595 [Planctomycetes bacterium]|nr:hypothetical protein [Planctomycetota bacterium]
MDSNAVFAILLLIVGIGILASEIFIPSGGILGLVTFLTLVASIVFAYRAWWTSNIVVFWSFCVVLLLLVPTTVCVAFYVLPHTVLGKRIFLEGPSTEDVTPFAKESDRLAQMVGRFGKTVTPLNPGGMIVLDGERIHALSEGIIVEANTSVEILEVRGMRLLVRPGEAPAELPSLNRDEDSAGPLDFEIPQS